MLIGSGSLKDKLEARIKAKSLSDLVILQASVSQDQLKTWYSAADILLMPSWNEPFGKVFIEAMACGTPTIASMTEGPMDTYDMAIMAIWYLQKIVWLWLNRLRQFLKCPVNYNC
jgi:glycosyltransferase involved in cell wall biosynthesis